MTNQPERGTELGTLSRFFDLSLDFLCVAGFDGFLKRINQTFVDRLGFAEDELLSRPFLSFLHPDDVEPTVTELKNLSDGKHTVHFENRYVTKSGAVLTLSWVARPADDGLIYAAARDVTNLRSAEGLSDRYKNAIDKSAIVAFTNRRGDITYVNDQFCRISGYDREELMGQNHRILNSGHHPHTFFVEMWKIIASGKVWKAEVCNRAKDGTRYWVDTTIVPFRDTRGRIEQYMAIRFDITARKQAEIELAQTSTLLENILNSTAGYMIVSTDKHGTIATFNKAAEQLSGYTAEEVIGQRTLDLFNDPAEIQAEAERLSKELGRPVEPGVSVLVEKARFGIVNGREWCAVRKDETRFPVSLSVSALRTDEGHLDGFLGVASDITERKQFEAALTAAKEEALAGTRAKSQFLANMSHEIRTPMNAIMGMSEVLMETNLDENQRRFAQTLHRSAGSLLGVINDILDISKIEAGHLEFEQIDFDLEDVVDEALEIMAVRAHEKQLELACVIDPSVPRNLVGDPTRLRQVLLNLVGNAIKFTEEGEVVIRVDRLHDEDGAHLLRFMVRDTGIGMSEEQVSRLFHRFSQADTSVTRRYGGTGLGLNISKHLVERMGGQISAESMPGEGTTFTFTAAFTPGDDRVFMAADATALRDRRVLIVDDNAINREVARQALGKWQMDVEEADSGERALEILRNSSEADRPIELLLLDARMPGLDGFQVAQAVKENPALVKCTMVMLTSDDRIGGVKQAQDVGINRYLVKPLRRKELLKALLDTMGSGQVVNGAASPVVEQPRDASSRGLRILLADDHNENRQLVQAFLAGTRHAITEVENGQLALAAFQAQAWDIVLMDMQMPVMDGYTATASIRQWELEQGRLRTPILALTAYALREEEQKSLAAGCDAHLTKPIKKATLLQALDRFTREARGEREAAVAPEAAAPEPASPPAGAREAVEVGVELKELVLAYLESRKSDAEQIPALVDQGEFDAIQVLGHRMKGVAPAYGFEPLGDIGARLETAGTSRGRAEALACADEMRSYLKRVDVRFMDNTA